MKLITRFLFVMAIFLVSGCGSQDRYQVIEPELYMPIEEGEFATFSRVHTLVNDEMEYSSVEVDGVAYFCSGTGSVYKKTDQGFEALPTVPDVYFRFLESGPDGLLWGSDNSGKVFSFQDNQWVLDVDLQISRYLKGLLFDNQGRLFAFGKEGVLWVKAPAGDWTSVDLPEGLILRDGWSDFGQDPVFVDEDIRLLTEGIDGWELSEPVGGYSYSSPRIQGNALGWLCVNLPYTQVMQLNQGDGWQEVRHSNFIGHIFWMGEELFGTSKNWDVLFRWSGLEWEQYLEFDDSIHNNCFDSQPSGNGRRLLFNDGASLFFDGTTTVDQTFPLGSVYGVASFGNSIHCILSSGRHYSNFEGEGIWTHVGSPLLKNEFFDDHSHMLVDDQNQLVVFGQDRIMVWLGGASYQKIPMDQRAGKIFPQPDGRVILVSENSLGIWAEGSFRFLGEHNELIHEILSCQMETEDRIWVTTDHHLRWIEPEQSAITLTFQGWECKSSVWNEERGLICGGDGRVIAVDGSRVQDISPAWGITPDWNPAVIRALVADAQGRPMAFDNNHGTVLLFHDGQWWSQDHVELERFNNWFTRVHLVDNRDGSLFLHYGSFVLLIEMGNGP